MTDVAPQAGGSGVAHKAAAVALAFVSVVLAIIIYFLLRPDPAILKACISQGGSGGGCPVGTASIAIPLIILFGGFSGARKVWRG